MAFQGRLAGCGRIGLSRGILEAGQPTAVILAFNVQAKGGSLLAGM